jgi:hypothetical protein
MVQPGGQRDLMEESLPTEDRGQLGPEYLDGDFAVVFEVAREVHGGHTAMPKFSLEHVAIAESVGERGGRVSQGTIRPEDGLNLWSSW